MSSKVINSAAEYLAQKEGYRGFGSFSLFVWSTPFMKRSVPFSRIFST